MSLTRIKVRRDTAANWAAENPVLADGEPGALVEAGQPSRLKLGDGVTAWADLPFLLDEETGNATFRPRRRQEPTASTLTWSTPTVSTATPKSVGLDGYVYGVAGGGSNQIVRSNNGFVSVESGVNFASAISDTGVLVSVTQVAEGCIAILTDYLSDAATATRIYFSATGFAGPFTLVHTLGAVNNISIGRPVATPDGTVMTVGEYGNSASRELYGTRDGGQTWTLLRTHAAADAGVQNHCHHAAYDADAGRLWGSFGDGVNSYFGYLDDVGGTWGSPSAWVAVPAAGIGPEIANSVFNHPTVIVVLDDRLALAPDGTTPIGVWNARKDDGYSSQALQLHPAHASTNFARGPIAQADGQEVYLLLAPDTSVNVTSRYWIIGTKDGGDSWHIVDSAHVNVAADNYSSGIVGPDSAGRLYLPANIGGSYTLKVATKPTWRASEGDRYQAETLTLLRAISYNPGTKQSVSRANADAGAIDAANLSVTFTAPPSGSVDVEVSIPVWQNTDNARVYLWLIDANGDVAFGQQTAGFLANAIGRPFYRQPVTGLVSGRSYTYRLAFSADGGGVAAEYGGAAGPASINVWAVL